ncbi:hypothetical protein [Qipengyuania flava]|uniref:hypothetical protein n=1 Tax=Qipengyuania flava TaxID=192812 RepID=UPI001C62CE3F|nr:hypothetical protein [Qipengyuania flava]QYJ07730.1 hypothetical protein KUV82_03140 [Qipengyuania flava]
MIEPAALGQIHFWIGCIAIVAGFTAFAAPKGMPFHVLAGRAFAVGMVLLALSGLWLSLARTILFTVFLSAITLHLVATAWASVAGQAPAARVMTKYAAFGSGAIGVGATWGAWLAAGSAGGELNGLPPESFLVLTSVALLIAAYDVAYARTPDPPDRRRLSRHLWRMGFAFFLATGIFFFGSNHVLPEALRTTAFLSAPVIAVVLWTALFAIMVRFNTLPSGPAGKP